MNEWWKPSQPNDIQPVPWIPPDATVYLESVLTPKMEVLEHGSGGSTLFMAARVKKVTAFEDDPDWLAVVKERAPENVKFGGRLRKSYDLLFLDGEPLEQRRQWIANAANFVKPGSWIVLDNANRPEYAKERAALAEFADLIERVDGNVQNQTTNTRFLVTEFWKVRDESRKESE